GVCPTPWVAARICFGLHGHGRDYHCPVACDTPPPCVDLFFRNRIYFGDAQCDDSANTVTLHSTWNVRACVSHLQSLSYGRIIIGLYAWWRYGKRPQWAYAGGAQPSRVQRLRLAVFRGGDMHPPWRRLRLAHIATDCAGGISGLRECDS